MEESQSILSVMAPSSNKMVKKGYESAKQPIITNASLKGQPAISFSTTDVYQNKPFKSILLHKRRLSNNNTLGLQNCDNTSTDNEDQTLNASKTLCKKIQNSHILKDFQVLYGFFPFDVQCRLLFRASDHHFSVQKFHQLCDYQTNTVTICKTKSNQIIGGYTPLPWAQDFDKNKTYFKTDKQNETFLFSINKNQKYPLAKAKKNKAICCFRNFGPTFGGGYDFQIGNKADQSYTSVSYFPRSFSCEAKLATQKHLTGSKNKQFKILEWQVYKVIKKKIAKPMFIQEMKNQQKQQSFLDSIKKGLLDFISSTKKQNNRG